MMVVSTGVCVEAVTVSTRRSWKDIRAERTTSVEYRVEDLEAVRLRVDLAQFVYDLRTETGSTQKELAERMGTTRSTIARLEGGGTSPSTELLRRLGRALSARLVLAVEGCATTLPPVVISKKRGARAT